MSADRPPLLVLALDTGDEASIDRWIGEGLLPTLGGLVERGARGRTGGPEMICEYGAGLTLFSGVSRADHGYYYFRQLAPRTYDLVSVRPPVEAAPPFWAALAGSAARALVVDVPDVRPLAGVPGLQLANWATHHGSVHAPEAEPPDLLADVERIFGPRIVLHADMGTEAEDRALVPRMHDRIRRKGALVRALLERGPFDVTVAFFSETDLASHRFWRYRAADGHPLQHAIRDVYAAVDRELGEILARAGGPEANVVALSLYGIQDEYPTSTLIESFLDALGYRVPAAAGAAAGGAGPRRRLDPLALARRVLPEPVRRALSRHLPAGAQERAIAHALRAGTDWSRTTAFAVPSLFTSFVRVNLKGREPRGIVAPGAEYEAVLGRLEADLALLVDDDTGAPAVRRASRAVDLFGARPPDSLPDLFVEWEPGPRMLERVRHPRGMLVQPRPAHCPDSQERLTGFLAAAGPSISARGDLGTVDLLDLAPTFLALLGRGPAPGMRGRPVPGLAP